MDRDVYQVLPRQLRPIILNTFFNLLNEESEEVEEPEEVEESEKAMREKQREESEQAKREKQREEVLLSGRPHFGAENITS